LIGNPVHGSIHLDESGFLKDGKSSVGVKRQYCGRFGKVDNCQVGVFLGYAFWSYRTLIDKRLYLPEEWANDPDRRELCSIPEEITFKTKAEWGWEMLLNARKGTFQRNGQMILIEESCAVFLKRLHSKRRLSGVGKCF
jgi:SRSO17 transposase